MNTEIIYKNIIGHISGLTESYREELKSLLKKTSFMKNIDIIDVDIITEKILQDNNMNLLFSKYEFYLEKSKDINISQLESKNILNKSKIIEQKMIKYWKAKMEYYLNKLIITCKKDILLIGYLSYFKNHKIYLNLNITAKFFIKVDFDLNAKTIIKYNLEKHSNDIINGEFDLNYLNLDFLIKKRIQLQNIYSKINYVVMSLHSIINTLQLLYYNNRPTQLFYSSCSKYIKKIPIMSNAITSYTFEWLSLVSILSETLAIPIQKGISDNKSYINIPKFAKNNLNISCYIYEIINTEDFLPFPTKENYKYFTVKPVKISRMIYIENILDKLKYLNIIVNFI